RSSVDPGRPRHASPVRRSTHLRRRAGHLRSGGAGGGARRSARQCDRAPQGHRGRALRGGSRMNAASAPLLAGDRVRLYLTLVPYLLERGQVTLDEAANDFGVTPREMRSMVEKLTVIGLPGDSGYWQLPQEMFDIDWDLLDEHDIIEITNDVALRRVPRFTAREAAADRKSV